MNKKRLLKLAAGMASIAGAGYTAAGYYLFRYACIRKSRISKRKQDDDRPVSEQQKIHRAAKAEWEKVPYTEVEIISRDGLKLKGKYYPAPDADRAVLCAHGYRGSSAGDFGTIAAYLKDSCSLLLIDERACGDSEGKYITFGAKEKDDIVRWTDQLIRLTDGRLPVYLFGVSMGSASVLLTSDQKLPSEVKGMIADCGYSSMKMIVSEVARDWFHLASFPVIDILGIFCRLEGHFSMRQADVKKALRKASLPVLFLHGLADDFVRPHHTYINAEACASPHETVLFEGAPHGSSCICGPVRYKEALDRFFRANDGKGL